MKPVHVGLAAAVALAGAVGALALLADKGEPVVPAGLVELQATDVVTHNGTGLLEVPAVLRDLAIRHLPVGATGAEPTVAVTRDGAIYVTGGSARVWKSTNAGATWRDVSPRPVPPRLDFDPFLTVDRATDRLYSVPYSGACSHLAWTDDGGASWSDNPLGGCGPVVHDHQSLVAGAPPAGATTLGYESVLYYTYNSRRGEGTSLVRSFDGGRSWETSARAIFPPDCHGGLNGAPATSRTGTLYVPKPGCVGVRIGVSADGGESWEMTDVDERGIGGGGSPLLPTTPVTPNPGVAVDRAGNAFVVFTGNDSLLHLTRSVDEGKTWSTPVRVTPPGVNATAFSAIVAGAPGRIAIAYLGTTNATDDWERRDAQAAPPDTVWHLYVTFALDALAPDPAFSSLRATPADDPVQIGCIWLAGATEASGCRNLQDFIGATLRSGRVLVAYADGCAKCRTAEESRRADLTLAAAVGGPSLA